MSTPSLSSLPREMRLSPRCMLTPASSAGSLQKVFSPYGKGNLNHSRQSSTLSNNSSSSSCMYNYHGRQHSDLGHFSLPPPPPPPLSLHSRQSSSSSSLKETPPRLPPRTSQKAFSPLCKNNKLSPTSLDLGYHTMVNNGESSGEAWDETSPFNSIELSMCSTSASVRPKPPEVPKVSLDPVNLIAEYKGKTSASKNSCSFDQIPDNVILQIFSNLNTNTLCLCARVCRRFYFLAWEPGLWRKIFLTGENLEADSALWTLLRLVSRDTPNVCAAVEKITMNKCAKLSDSGLRLIADKCPEIQHLELKGCLKVTNGGLREVVTNCANLQWLDITGCTEISTVDFRQCEPNPATAAVGGVPPAHSRSLLLRFLDLTDCIRLTDTGLALIASNCPHLTQLYLRRCLNITDVGVKHVTSQCLSLKEFSVSDCVQVTDFALYELAKLGPNLRYLSVAKCDQISDSGIKQIAKLCYKLRYLNVRGCEAVSDEAVEVLAKSCSRLRSLDLGKCDITDSGLRRLGESVPNLKKLSVKSCEMVSDRGIQSIAYNCRGLQHLNIQDCPVTIDGYRTVKKYCRRCIIEHTNPGFY